MRLCIPIPDRAEGGLYTFLRYLRAWAEREGVEICDDIGCDYDVLFANSFVVPFEALRAAYDRLPCLRIVHRIDGAAADYGRDPADDRRQARANVMADATVFQSRYSRYATRRKYRVIGARGVVIPNPVDTNRFTPDGECEDLVGACRVGHVSFSTNPSKGAADVVQAALANPKVTFYLVGRYGERAFPPNIVLLGVIDHLRLPRLLRSCHALGFFSENEACPNVVLEAMASGLPVLYRDSGATAELVGEAGLATTPERFAEAMRTVVRDRPQWAMRARRRAEDRFALERIMPQYMTVLRGVRRRRTPARWRLGWRWLLGYPVRYM
jgi:glycosyltransferase involved in cell wall biosynthesis